MKHRLLHPKVMCRALCTLLWVSGALAAEVVPGGVEPAGCDKLGTETHCYALALRGRIVVGDSQKLAARMTQIETMDNQSIKMRVGMVKLDSLGGDVAEAMKIGKMLRTRQVTTFVTADSECASSCVLVLAGGVQRIVFGPVAIHSFYSPDLLGSGDFTRSSRRYDEVARSIEDYLREMRVSRSLLDAMMQVPHDTVKQLSLEELSSFGLVGTDPAYAQSRKPKK